MKSVESTSRDIAEYRYYLILAPDLGYIEKRKVFHESRTAGSEVCSLTIDPPSSPDCLTSHCYL